MRIDSNGNVGINTTANGAYKLDISGQTRSTGITAVGSGVSGSTLNVTNDCAGDCRAIWMEALNPSNTSIGFLYMRSQATGTAAWNFIDLDAATNVRFKFRGDGNAYADGSWNGGGADYAEFVKPVAGTGPMTTQRVRSFA